MKKQFNNNRAEKIASKVQILAAEILRDKFSDDAILSRVNLVGAESHGGLQFVKIFFYADEKEKALRRLEEIKNILRYELAARMDQRYVPDFKFVYDDTLEKSARIDALLAEIKL